MENNNEWSIKITKVDNGFILEKNSDEEKNVDVFQELNNSMEYKEADKQYIIDMLCEMVDFFGIDLNGKYSRQRIEIKMRQGCKYEKE